MNIAIAQIHLKPGQIEQNLDRHFRLAQRACEADADLLVFPELSITAYMTESAAEYAKDIDSWCETLVPLQRVADEAGMTIVVGAPLKANRDVHISSIVLRPDSVASAQLKHFLYEDEEPFYTAGKPSGTFISLDPNVSLAICYELSVPAHLESALSAGANVYVASVANHARGVSKAHQRLAKVAKANRIITMMCNCIGRHDADDLVGKSAAWGRDGQLLGELDTVNEGIIQVDSDTELVKLIGL